MVSGAYSPTFSRLISPFTAGLAAVFLSASNLALPRPPQARAAVPTLCPGSYQRAPLMSLLCPVPHQSPAAAATRDGALSPHTFVKISLLGIPSFQRQCWRGPTAAELPVSRKRPLESRMIPCLDALFFPTTVLLPACAAGPHSGTVPLLCRPGTASPSLSRPRTRAAALLVPGNLFSTIVRETARPSDYTPNGGGRKYARPLDRRTRLPAAAASFLATALFRG